LRLSAAGLAGSAAHPDSLEPENNAGASAPSISIAIHRDYVIREVAPKDRTLTVRSGKERDLKKSRSFVRGVAGCPRRRGSRRRRSGSGLGEGFPLKIITYFIEKLEIS